MPQRSKPLEEDKDKKVILHAILFPKSNYNMTSAKKWLKENNFNYIHNRQTTNYYRFRIKEQIKDWKFSTKIMNIYGIQFIFMIKP